MCISLVWYDLWENSGATKADVTEMSGHSDSLQFAFAIVHEAQPRNTEMRKQKKFRPPALCLAHADQPVR